jgi:hypothetical protein
MTPEGDDAALLSQVMPVGQQQDLSLSIAPSRLSDLIAAASSPEPVMNDDGSTTIYVRLIPSERFSMLPRPVRKSRRSGDALTARANVRKVPRRTARIW